jgi:exosome complex RNA-binding protein Rrp4
MFVTFWQYIPSVEDTVLGIVVDTKPDVSIHLPLEVLSNLPYSHMIAYIANL